MRCLVALTVTLAGAAFAGPSGLQLTWVAPEGCPQRDQVDAAVARMLGDETERTELLTVDAVITLDARTFTLDLKRPDGTSRVLTGATCRAVAEAAVVVLALMVDPLARTDLVPQLEPDEGPRWSLGAAALADTHALPRLAPGFGLGAGIRLGAGFWFELRAFAFLPQSRTTDAAGAGATASFFGGAIGARRDFDLGPLTLAPLVAFEAGAQRGRSFGVSDPAVNVGVWTAVEAGLLVAITFGPFRTGLRASAVVPLTRPRFVVAGVGEVHTSAPVTARGTFFIELRFSPRSQGGPRN